MGLATTMQAVVIKLDTSKSHKSQGGRVLHLRILCSTVFMLIEVLTTLSCVVGSCLSTTNLLHLSDFVHHTIRDRMAVTMHGLPVSLPSRAVMVSKPQHQDVLMYSPNAGVCNL